MMNRRAFRIPLLLSLAVAAFALQTGSRLAFAGALENMISPVSVPTLNEDPRVDTEIRPMYMFTSISNGFATQGGKYQVIAVQARAAITDRIGFIATKDGYIFLDPDKAVPDHTGWANVAFGFKGAVWKDEEHRVDRHDRPALRGADGQPARLPGLR